MVSLALVNSRGHGPAQSALVSDLASGLPQLYPLAGGISQDLCQLSGIVVVEWETIQINVKTQYSVHLACVPAEHKTIQISQKIQFLWIVQFLQIVF